MAERWPLTRRLPTITTTPHTLTSMPTWFGVWSWHWLSCPCRKGD